MAAVITRRPEAIKKSPTISGDYDVLPADKPNTWDSLDLDVAILCGGSKTDLPVQGPLFASYFNTVDSFDDHDHIHPWTDKNKNSRLGYFKEVNNAARAKSNTSIICGGWDPGTFSLMRYLFDAIVPGSNPKPFYGLGEKGGLSMGHSDAIRRIEIDGAKVVEDARQYTHAIPETIENFRSGKNPNPTKKQLQWRECQVALKKQYDDSATREKVQSAIKNMPGYFEPYDTTVEFVPREKLSDDMQHDGTVIAVGETSPENKARIEYSNFFDSNPESTSLTLVALARAAHRMSLEGKVGAQTIKEAVPYMSPRSEEYILKNLM